DAIKDVAVKVSALQTEVAQGKTQSNGTSLAIKKLEDKLADLPTKFPTPAAVPDYAGLLTSALQPIVDKLAALESSFTQVEVKLATLKPAAPSPVASVATPEVSSPPTPEV